MAPPTKRAAHEPAHSPTFPRAPQFPAAGETPAPRGAGILPAASGKIVAQGQTYFAIQTRRQELSDAEMEEQRIRSEGANAMQDGDYDTATSVIEFAKFIFPFRFKENLEFPPSDVTSSTCQRLTTNNQNLMTTRVAANSSSVSSFSPCSSSSFPPSTSSGVLLPAFSASGSA